MVNACYSHSIVAGGLELMSYTTRLTPFTFIYYFVGHFVQKFIRKMCPVGRHGIGGCNCAQCDGVLVGAFIPHHTHRLHRQQDGSCLPDFVIKASSTKIRDKYIIRLLGNAYFSGVILPRIRIPNPGPGKG